MSRDLSWASSGRRKDHALRCCGGGRAVRGQALLVAIMIMLLVVLVLALFTAIAISNQSRTTQHAGRVNAQAVAQALVRYADQQLQHHPYGADWRPQSLGQDAASGTYIPPNPPIIFDPDGDLATPVDVMTAQYSAGFWGPDDIPDTEDDYYTHFELQRGWYGVRAGTAAAPGAVLRQGFRVYPDPMTEDVGDEPLTLGQGRGLLRVTYDPDPPFEPEDGPNPQPDPLSKYIKIEAIGIVQDEGTQFLRQVAYKPIGLTDYARFITDKTNTGQPAILGVDPDFSAVGIPGKILMRFTGGIKCNTVLDLRGDDRDYSDGDLTDDPSTVFYLLGGSPPLGFVNGPRRFLRDDYIEAASGIEVTQSPASPTPVRHSQAWKYVYDAAAGQFVTSSAVPGGIGDTYLSNGAVNPSFDTGGGIVRDGVQGLDPSGRSRFARPLTAPSLFEKDPRTGHNRYYMLTAESGIPSTGSATAFEQQFTGAYANIGKYGYGRGIYIDNFSDIQFGHDVELLKQDLRQVLDANDARAVDSGWNELGTDYTPPGVEIEILPDDSYYRFSAGPPPVEPGYYWFPDSAAHAAGEPVLKIVRHDKQWARTNGLPSGENARLFNWPVHGVIYAEGNVRVKGIMPSRATAVSLGLVRSDGTYRDFDLTIVSGGTIYIEGNILQATDVDPLTANGARDNSYLALLSRDCVVLNTTKLVPQYASGGVRVEPDDEQQPGRGKHYELGAPPDVIWTDFQFGRDPLTPVAAGTQGREPLPAGGIGFGAPQALAAWTLPLESSAATQISLVAKQCGEDPGPSAVRMLVNQNPYDFDQNSSDGVLHDTFYFLPAGESLPGANPGPQPYVSHALSPNWEVLASFGGPLLPWGLAYDSGGAALPDLAYSPLAKNRIALRQPQMETLTEYWLKKFKLEERDAAGPRGTVHCRVNALIYAERGSWLVIPGQYFEPDPSAPAPMRFRRYNYDIEVVGPITENMTAGEDFVRDWLDKTSYPAGGAWYQMVHRYGGSHMTTRDWRGTGAYDWRLNTNATRQAMCPVYPCLPVSPDLIYEGEMP